MKIYSKTILTAILIAILNYSCDALCGDEEDRSYHKEDISIAKADTIYIEKTNVAE